ncbi:hypothetical protein XAP6164_1370016 [Xanthomonas phaseoli pv. phaseoli]|nr:hypothetical protein XAP6164_1370016 [Xanthomonas phaseoli pv. phaseoli]
MGIGESQHFRSASQLSFRACRSLLRSDSTAICGLIRSDVYWHWFLLEPIPTPESPIPCL